MSDQITKYRVPENPVGRFEKFVGWWTEYGLRPKRGMRLMALHAWPAYCLYMGIMTKSVSRGTAPS